MINEKRCRRCEETKPVTEFHKSKQNKDGLKAYCKKCVNADNKSREGRYKETKKAYRQTEKYKQIKRDYYANNKEAVLDMNRKWRKETFNGRLLSYKRSAEKRNFEWGITNEEFGSFWQLPCNYCGGDIETIGLDRVDSSAGYTMDNIVPCCSVCNKMKLDLSEDVFFTHIKKIHEKMGLTSS